MLGKLAGEYGGTFRKIFLVCFLPHVGRTALPVDGTSGGTHHVVVSIGCVIAKIGVPQHCLHKYFVRAQRMGEARKDFGFPAEQILAEGVRDAHPLAALAKLPIGAAAEARDFLQQQQAVAQGGCEAVYGGALVFQVLREDIVAAHLAAQIFIVPHPAPKVDELLAGISLEKAVQVVLAFYRLVCTRQQMIVQIRAAPESRVEE